MKGKYKTTKNEPCKNQYPDISNKNKINNTTIDFRDIENKINRERRKG